MFGSCIKTKRLPILSYGAGCWDLKEALFPKVKHPSLYKKRIATMVTTTTPTTVKVLGTSQPRWADKKIPSFISYWMTFLAFPLNMMLLSCSFFCYGIFISHNIYLRISCILYMSWMVLWDRKRCDGIGYPCDKFPFNNLRQLIRKNWLYATFCAYFPIRLHKLAELPAKDPKTGRKCQYLFACHPHGVIGVGTMSVFATDEVGFKELYPGIDTYTTGKDNAAMCRTYKNRTTTMKAAYGAFF